MPPIIVIVTVFGVGIGGGVEVTVGVGLTAIKMVAGLVSVGSAKVSPTRGVQVGISRGVEVVIIVPTGEAPGNAQPCKPSAIIPSTESASRVIRI